MILDQKILLKSPSPNLLPGSALGTSNACTKGRIFESSLWNIEITIMFFSVAYSEIFHGGTFSGFWWSFWSI